MTKGFRVAIPGNEARTAAPKQVITDTTLISLPIHWEGSVNVSAPGGVRADPFDTTPVNASGTVYHDLTYAPLTRAWSTAILSNGTDYVEDATRKLSIPVLDGGFLFQTYGYKDRVVITAKPSGFIDAHTWLAYTIHVYLYIFEFKADGITHG